MADSANCANETDDVDDLFGDDDAAENDGEQISTADNKDWNVQEKQDDAEINRVLSSQDGRGIDLGIGDFGDKVIDQSFKDKDAQDFEDISDGDLASDDGSQNNAVAGMSQIPALTEDESTSHDDDKDFADLFGEGGDQDLPPSSPPAKAQQRESSPIKSQKGAAQDPTPEQWAKMTAEQRWQYNLQLTEDWVSGQVTNQDSLAPPENLDELLEQTYPSWGPHKILNFREIFADWPAEYKYAEPNKSPPELIATKLELELDVDSSKLFRIPDSVLNNNQKKSQQHYGEGDGWVQSMLPAALEVDDNPSDSDDENELVGGYTLNEIATVCEDWDNIHAHEQNGLITLLEDEPVDEWTREMFGSHGPQTKKKRKYEPQLPDISSFDAWGINHFEEATKRSARRVVLDRNDPYLLLDDMQSERPNKRPRLEEKTKRMANGQLGRDVLHRFNISNDDAYGALKNNNKSKIRATLSNFAVEHSLPALKLTFPFYRTKIATQFWEHHRKKFDVDKIVRQSINFRKPTRIKRRDQKNKSVQELFKNTKDLSLNDNSTAVLFEYCEQAPMMMSNFGMGNRIINYYRRKGIEDDDKPPKPDLGEPHVLLPEDKSPFSTFGEVEAGEIVPTLHNEMYKAPIFKHQPRKNDFLLGYTTNVAEGPKWYLRAIDHLYVVGQIFPSMEVPGPHARRVTNTAKNRLKMIAYRLMRRSETQDVHLKQITNHLWEKDDAQNRQKLKEFLSYDRETKKWAMPPGQPLLDGAAIRAMIKPEDVCAIESMQVGTAQLAHAGFDAKDSKGGGANAAAEEDEDLAPEEALIVKMSPWELSKNFLEACQNKAMVQLHGEGDPTGHGLGFSFIKTSMKGGYINAVTGPGATSAAAMERERKQNGGHSYNVKKQQDMYNSAIRNIWGRQKETLSDGTTHQDDDLLDTTNEDDRLDPIKHSASTPANHMDDGRSMLSRVSGGSRVGKRKVKITRRVKGPDGQIIDAKPVLVEDPAVIRSYMKQRDALKTTDIYDVKPTGDADRDRENARHVEQELARLVKNAERRQVREKQGKGKRKNANPDAASVDLPGSADKAAGGTTRKCANCGQVGHIKTNKSKCPLLNGTMANNAADEPGFGSFGRLDDN